MTSLRKLQSSFMAFLLEGDKNVAAQLRAGSEGGLAIYANAYTARLVGALRVDHEVLRHFLGEQRFDDLARKYVLAHPSRLPSLRSFGTQWPEFLARHASPGVAEIARFERLLLDVFDAADGASLAPEELQNLPAPSWPDLRLEFHPALRVFESSHSSVHVWRAIKMDEKPPPLEEVDSEKWLLWRNRERVSEFRSLGESEHRALALFRKALPLSAICDRLSATGSADQIVAGINHHLRRWLTDGIVAAIDTAP